MSRFGRTYIPWKSRTPPVVGSPATATLPDYRLVLGAAQSVHVSARLGRQAPAWRDRGPSIIGPRFRQPFLRENTGATRAVLDTPVARRRRPVRWPVQEPPVIGPYVAHTPTPLDASLPTIAAQLVGGGGDGTRETKIFDLAGPLRITSLAGALKSTNLEGH